MRMGENHAPDPHLEGKRHELHHFIGMQMPVARMQLLRTIASSVAISSGLGYPASSNTITGASGVAEFA